MNKFLFSITKFKYPIFLTMMHMGSCTIFSLVGIYGMGVVKPKAVKSFTFLVKVACKFS